MNIRQINFRDGTTGVCEVVEGGSGRTFRATTHAVAIALLGAESPEDAVNASTGEIQWTDYLSTHGLAVGSRGKRSFILGVLPGRERTVRYTGPLDTANASRNLTCQFPPILLGLMREGSGPRSFRNAVVFAMPHATNLSTLGVTVGANVATSFPYGNVYAGSGKICWGNVPHNHIQTIKDLEELFFGSDFNGDLYGAGGGRLVTLARAHSGKPLPLSTVTTNLPGVIRLLAQQE